MRHGEGARLLAGHDWASGDGVERVEARLEAQRLVHALKALRLLAEVEPAEVDRAVCLQLLLELLRVLAEECLLSVEVRHLSGLLQRQRELGHLHRLHLLLLREHVELGAPDCLLWCRIEIRCEDWRVGQNNQPKLARWPVSTSAWGGAPHGFGLSGRTGHGCISFSAAARSSA